MLDGLERINWMSVGYHVYGKQETIPEEIQNLLSPNSEVREEARGFLLGSGQDFGDIYDTTPYIIPFLMELLARDDTPDRDHLLYHLSGVAEYRFNHEYLSIHMMRLCLQTYDALRAGLPLLLHLLTEAPKEVRQASAELLQYMTDEVESLIPDLLARFRNEQEEEVQIALLRALKTLFHSLEWPRYALKTQFAPVFKEIVETHPSHVVRVAAARASVELVGMFSLRVEDQISPQAGDLLAQEFLTPVAPLDYREQDIASYHKERIVRDLARLRPEPLLRLLNHPDISAEDAHLIARALLAQAFLLGGDESHWWHVPSYARQAEGAIYFQHYEERPTLHHATKAIVQAVVDADKVWEQPTNLFSFFYGLPDSREALRALLDG
jgi:hypothetical protein